MSDVIHFVLGKTFNNVEYSRKIFDALSLVLTTKLALLSEWENPGDKLLENLNHSKS